jgi:hypothetical protein
MLEEKNKNYSVWVALWVDCATRDAKVRSAMEWVGPTRAGTRQRGDRQQWRTEAVKNPGGGRWTGGRRCRMFSQLIGVPIHLDGGNNPFPQPLTSLRHRHPPHTPLSRPLETPPRLPDSGVFTVSVCSCSSSGPW